MSIGVLELAAVVGFAAVLGIAAKALRQPVILAYLAAGVFIAYFGFFNLASESTFKIFSDLGIMFLLFLVGLEINYSSLRIAGKPSVVVGLGQVIFAFVIGYFIALQFGFEQLEAAYISVALTFSSTIIVVKLLSDKKDLNSLYGRISVGMMLVQDFIAIFILILLSGVEAGKGVEILPITIAVLKGLVLVVVVFWLGKRFFPWLFEKIARSEELLFLTSTAWVFLFAAALSELGFSIEIAGLLAGLALANSSENFQIASRIRPLRDFFIMIFFVILGASLIFTGVKDLGLPAVVLSLFVLIGNPLIVLIIMGLMGYRRRTSFLTGITTAQISEFSMILGAVGLKLGHFGENVLGLITAVGVVTITLSTYMIIYSRGLYKFLSWPLRLFEKKNAKEEEIREEIYEKPIVLVGCGRTGASIAYNLPKEKLLIVDFNPEEIESLRRRGYEALFGDIADSEIFEKANFPQAALAISTSSDFEDNMVFLEEIKKLPRRPKIILRAETEREARAFYAAGADYVLLPHFTSGQYLGKTLAIDPEMEILDSLRERDLALMQKVNHAV
ncbi:MAG: Transporter, CPA2 family [Candidatus Jorgensenbacteria bacterium GW2011_GWA1_48_13]|uniref:Transporter, CPA2 family n=1 Tax=Candidatus Jorgensenbacteria bacterium GW2011_GWB1_50_10 TaxID=1618665 RepID=A0A0G1W9E3_9BACT|nr:MAG: Transporter, CPA2 family [Candidatus Jorgensenbacteria bacterium GW2011_GWA1_48_13]KKW15421.1 MAG: Transporter, CPA2 family [Candidatus Jorgensenbacteria bacterium GW2011_GWB1_50_10]